MIEWRARRKLEKARETIPSLRGSAVFARGTGGKRNKTSEVPLIVLHEGDKRHIRIRTDIIEIVRLLKAMKPVAGGVEKLSVTSNSK